MTFLDDYPRILLIAYGICRHYHTSSSLILALLIRAISLMAFTRRLQGVGIYENVTTSYACRSLLTGYSNCYPTTFCKFLQPSAAFGSVRSLNYIDQNMSCHLIFAKSNTVRYNNPARQLIIALHSHLTMHHCCGGSPQIAKQDTTCCWLPTF